MSKAKEESLILKPDFYFVVSLTLLNIYAGKLTSHCFPSDITEQLWGPSSYSAKICLVSTVSCVMTWLLLLCVLSAKGQQVYMPICVNHLLYFRIVVYRLCISPGSHLFLKIWGPHRAILYSLCMFVCCQQGDLSYVSTFLSWFIKEYPK